MTNITLPWIIDPKDGKPSVSLSILVISVVIVLIAFGLNISGLAKDTSLALEFFGVASGVYVGRKFQFSKGSMDAVNGTSNG